MYNFQFDNLHPRQWIAFFFDKSQIALQYFSFLKMLPADQMQKNFFGYQTKHSLLN